MQEYIGMGTALIISMLVCVAIRHAPGSEEDFIVVSIDDYRSEAIYMLEMLEQLN